MGVVLQRRSTVLKLKAKALTRLAMNSKGLVKLSEANHGNGTEKRVYV